MNHRDTSTDTAAQLLTVHYQETFSLTYDFWRQRNRLFLWLIAAVVIATSLGAPFGPVRSILIAVALRYADDSRKSALAGVLENDPVFAIILQTGLLLVVFYLMFSLYHRNSNVRRLYDYLARLEADIRSRGDFGAVAFTREGQHYWGWQPVPLRVVGILYSVMIGLLLAAFFGLRLWQDSIGQFPWLVILDLIVALGTGYFFLAYVSESSRWKRRFKESHLAVAAAGQTAQRRGP